MREKEREREGLNLKVTKDKGEFLFLGCSMCEMSFLFSGMAVE